MTQHIYDVEWLIGLCLGLLSIALFANERLNRLSPGSGNASRRERLLRILQPAMMRRPGVYFRGLLFYFVSLAALYILVAIFGSYLGPLIGAQAGIPELAPSDPIWPVAIALTLVGLLPGIPGLDRIDAKARAVTLRLLGVPETLNDFADRLMAVEMKPGEIPEDLLDPREAESLHLLLRRAGSILGTGSDYQALEQSAIKLWCFREWQSRPGEWPGANVRRQYEPVEEIIRPDALAVIEDFERLPAPQAVAEADRAIEHSSWRSAAERAAFVTDDVCVLFALYAERAESFPVRMNPISATLRLLISRAAAAGKRPAPVDSVLLVLLAVMLAAFIVGFTGATRGILAAPDASGKDVFLASMDYVFRVGATSGLATAMALIACHGTGWVNALDVGQPQTRQYLGLAVKATAVTALVIGPYAFFQQLSSHMEAFPGTADARCVIWQFLSIAPSQDAREACIRLLEYDPTPDLAAVWFIMPLAVLAGQSAVAMALLFDARMAQVPRPRVVRAILLVQPLISAGIMFMAGVFLDLLASDAIVVLFESLAWGALSFLLFAMTAWFGARARPAAPATMPAPGQALTPEG